MAKINTKKQKLINLINETSFSFEEKRREWIELVEFMDKNELKEIYEHFEKRKIKEKEIKLRLITKYGLEDVYMKGIDNLSKVFINKNKKK